MIAKLPFLFAILIFNFFGSCSKKLLPPDHNLNIYALPVGQGDCTVIQCPSAYGKEISIIDAGSTKTTGFGANDLVNFIEGQTIKNIILTHPHKDHINYVDDIFFALRKSGKQYPNVYHSCDWANYERFVTDSTAKENAYRVMKCCGWEECDMNLMMCDSSVHIKIIGSELDDCNGEGSNGDSIVSIVEHDNNHYTLVAGDFEGSKMFVENFLKCAYVNAEIYRLSHHGAYNGKANTKTFLSSVDAHYVFTSSGLNNGYKHPRCELYDYYTDDSHPAAIVEDHPFVCYNSDGTLQNIYTDRAIYTTTLNGGDNDYKNYLIKFAIDVTESTITPYLYLVDKN